MRRRLGQRRVEFPGGEFIGIDRRPGRLRSAVRPLALLVAGARPFDE